MQTTELSAIFTDAARHISTYGHQQGAFCAPDIDAWGHPRYASTPHQYRPVDFVGAINVVCGGDPRETSEQAHEALRFASQHLQRTAPMTDGRPDYVEQFALWSDVEGRTRADVAQLLHRLAAKAIEPAGSVTLLAVAA
jgi:hypothetical protein